MVGSMSAIRRARSGKASENVMARFVELVRDPFDRDQFLTDARAILDHDELDRGEPDEAAGKAQHLAVMPKRRIDEARRAEIDLSAHEIPIA